MTFFATLTSDLAIRILQSVQTERDALISDPASPFRAHAEEMFVTVVVDSENTAAISYRIDANTVAFGSIYKKAPSITLGYGINESIAAKVLKSLGSNATRLELFDMSDIHEMRFAELLIESSKNINEMVVHCEEPTENYMSAIQNLVFAYKEKLTRLEFYGLHQVERRLVIRIIRTLGYCSQLKRFVLCGKYLPLKPLWKDIGRSLEEIELTAYADQNWLEIYGGIGTHCRSIKVLILNGPRQVHNVAAQESAYLNLLKSYGKQLLSANPFKLLQNHHLKELSRACPNIQCSLTVIGNQFGQLAATANRVSNLTLELAATNNWNLLFRTFATCSNLSYLTLRNYHVLRGAQDNFIFNRRFQHLRHLKICRFQYDRAKVEELGEATGGLKQLELDLDSVGNVADDYGPLVLANPGLEKIILLENMNPPSRNRSNEQATRILTDLIRTFLYCQDLHTIELRMNAARPPADVWKEICHRNKLRRISCRLELIDTHYFSDLF